MKLLALNASPRGASSNSAKIIDWMLGAGPDAVERVDLAPKKDFKAVAEAIARADRILVAFPLYTDSVPGIFKALIEELGALPRERLKGKEAAFVVHSGFSEAIHSEGSALYMERLCGRLGWRFLGAAIKGGSEGFRLMPDKMTEKTRRLFASLGADFLAGRPFDAAVLEKLAGRRRFGLMGRLAMRAMAFTGLGNMYWNWMLKKHGAWERRFDRPYADALGGWG
jgi:hypothetical protein